MLIFSEERLILRENITREEKMFLFFGKIERAHFVNYFVYLNDEILSIFFKQGPWGPFLERPGNLTSPISYFEIKVSRRVVCVLTSNEVQICFFS